MTWSVTVHGGVDTEANDDVLTALRKAARTALDALREGQSPVSAAVEAVTVLEDDPLFNAGTGSVLNADGIAEADAGVVDGAESRFAGVAALSGIKNPVQAAAVLLNADVEPVLLVGEGARRFACEAGLEEAALITPEQRRTWSRIKENDGLGSARSVFTGKELPANETVGAIIGPGPTGGSIAAAASTGGVLMKLPGRVGDSAIFGAGIYADSEVAFLCSGQGEATIELNLAVRLAMSSVTTTLVGVVRSGMELGHRRKGMCGGIVGYNRRSHKVAAATNALSFPVVTATAQGENVVAPIFIGSNEGPDDGGMVRNRWQQNFGANRVEGWLGL